GGGAAPGGDEAATLGGPVGGRGSRPFRRRPRGRRRNQGTRGHGRGDRHRHPLGNRRAVEGRDRPGKPAVTQAPRVERRSSAVSRWAWTARAAVARGGG